MIFRVARWGILVIVLHFSMSGEEIFERIGGKCHVFTFSYAR